MTSRLTLLALGLSGLLGLVGCGGYYEEAAYPEVPPPAPRQVEAAPQPEAVPPPSPTDELIVGGDNDDETLYRETDPSALTEFKSTLDPHGTWVDDDTYGTVWVPSTAAVGADFTPYVTAGRWTYDDGYVWVSDYDWGWAPFHYGRWVYIGGRGWSWIPGRVYRGAWVTWRTGPSGFGYVGWGPMAPSWYWRGGYAYGYSGGYRTPYYFCETRHVFQPQVQTHVVRGPMAGDIGKRTEAYVPAEPRIDQGRVGANPRVAGAGTGSAGASGLVGPGAAGLRRGAPGPELGMLGHESTKVPRPSDGDKGLSRAYALGAPKSAVAIGARPPSVSPRPLDSVTGRAPAVEGPRRVGGTGPVAPSVTERPSVAQTQTAPTRLPPLRNERSFAPSPSVAPVPRMSEASRSSMSSPPLVEHHRSPSYADSFRPAPSYRGGSTSSPSFSSSPSVSSSFRSSGATRVAPSSGGGGGGSVSSSFRSNSATSVVRSAPSSGSSFSGGGSVRSSAPSGGGASRIRR